MTTPSDRRGELVYLALVDEVHRSKPRQIRRWAAKILPDLCAQAGVTWTGRLDLAEITAELAKVRAVPGDYTPESYERWRLSGLPIWAALAAGLTPTPGSHKLLGRRPGLP